MVAKERRNEILNAINEIGENAATILEIEKRVSLGRHALSKYLHILRKEGYVDYNPVGKAKIWYINKAPLKQIFKSLPEDMTYLERLLYDIIQGANLGVMIIDSDYYILFMNEDLIDDYEDCTGKKFYKEILGMKNPLKLKALTKIIDNVAEKGKFRVLDKFNNIIKVAASRLYSDRMHSTLVLLIEDVTKQRRRIQELKYEKEISKLLFNYSEHGIIITDSRHIVVRANDIATDLLGKDPTARSMENFIADADKFMPKLFKQEKRKERNIILKTRSGDKKCDVLIHRLDNKRGRLKFFLYQIDV